LATSPLALVNRACPRVACATAAAPLWCADMAWLVAYLVIGLLLAEAGQRRGMFKGSWVVRVLTYLFVIIGWLPGIAWLAVTGTKGEEQ
jgi:hypothetical protein